MQAAPGMTPRAMGVRLQCYGEGPRGLQSQGYDSPELSGEGTV